MNFYNWLLLKKQLSYNTTKIYWYWTNAIDLSKFPEEYEQMANTPKKRIVYFAFKYYYEFLGKTLDVTNPPKCFVQKNILSISLMDYHNIQDNFIDNNTQVSLNGKIIAKLAFIYGMRIGEILNMKWEDIQDGVAEIIGKGSKKRLVPISDRLSSHATFNKGYIVNINGKKISYSCARNILETIKKRLNLKSEITWHSFRHGCAIRMLNTGVNIYNISIFLGHSNINTTTIYLKYKTSDLKKQMKKLGLFA